MHRNLVRLLIIGSLVFGGCQRILNSFVFDTLNPGYPEDMKRDYEERTQSDEQLDCEVDEPDTAPVVP